MKKVSLIFVSFVLLCCLIFSSCGVESSSSTSQTNTSGDAQSSITAPESVTVQEPSAVSDAESDRVDITAAFSVTTDVTDGYTIDGSTVTITKGGEYTLSGQIEDGQILIRVSDDEEVDLYLSGVSLGCSYNSPIWVYTGSKLTLHAVEDTYNEILDNRSAQTGETEDESVGNAAVYSEIDLKLVGSGSLYVLGGFNNGIQTKDDLKIKDLTLKVRSVNHALKGNDSVSIESGNIVLISETGDGIKTENSDVSSKGNQRGIIFLSGGKISITSYCDGIDAAYDVQISGDPEISITTGSYAKSLLQNDEVTITLSEVVTYAPGGWGGGFNPGGPGSGSTKVSGTGKGIKADNAISISGGLITITSDDDGIHANNDVTLENTEAALGDITISAGSITITSLDDGIHADNAFVMDGGYINILTSYEGIEAKTLTFNAGTTYVYGTDDGLNATDGTSSGGLGGFGRTGQSTASTSVYIKVTGGYLEVSTPSGDTDAIDSNGNYVQTGGFVLVRGGSSSGSVAGSVDTDGSITVTGGTIVAFGGICEIPGSGSCNTAVFNRKSFSKGDYVLTDTTTGETIGSFSLASNYSSLWISSASLTKGHSYQLSVGSSTVGSWTQSGQSVSAS